ncbi:MAG: hypothetical protein RBS78_02950 [Coriobacteriia bacterium]|jgi:branched-subunit amino acid transport protein|nr:hypothetical protein [Coriobacteriia bacterium]
MMPLVVIVSSTLGWPLVELAVFWLRFRHLPPNGAAEALVFVPMGLLAGIVAASLMIRASTDRQRRSVMWGYLIASPFALVGAILGGLVLSGIWGPLVAGGMPLSIGCLGGFVIGRSRDETA